MKISALSLGTVLWCLAWTSTAIPVADDAAQLSSVLNDAVNTVLKNLAAEEKTLTKRGIVPSCRVDNIAIRREL